MRRIVSACLLQTMKFDTSSEANPEHDFEVYCNKMNKSKIKYVIEEKKKEADGTLIVKVRKQYNTYSIGEYLD